MKRHFLIFCVVLSPLGALGQLTNEQRQIPESKWNFASAQVQEENKKTGTIYSGKMVYSENEIDDKVYFLDVPVAIEFFGGNGDAFTTANVKQRYGYIGNARVILNNETLLLLVNDAALPAEGISNDPASYNTVARQYEKFQLSGKSLSLEYTYMYMNGGDLISDVMTINFKPWEENPGHNSQAYTGQAKTGQDKPEQKTGSTTNTAPQTHGSDKTITTQTHSSNSVIPQSPDFGRDRAATPQKKGANVFNRDWDGKERSHPLFSPSSRNGKKEIEKEK